MEILLKYNQPSIQLFFAVNDKCKSVLDNAGNAIKLKVLLLFSIKKWYQLHTLNN